MSLLIPSAYFLRQVFLEVAFTALHPFSQRLRQGKMDLCLPAASLHMHTLSAPAARLPW